MGATLLDRTTGPQNEQDIAAAGDTRYALDTRILNINGGVEVSQELGLTGLTLASATQKYFADMWEGYYVHAAATAVITVGQIAATSFPVALNGFPNGAQIKATTALSAPANGDVSFFRHKIEGLRTARLGWGAANPSPISYGFWFYATVSGTIFTRIQNSAGNRSYHHEHTVTGGIWNWCSFTVPGDVTGTWLKDNGIGIYFDVMVAGKSAAPSAPDTWGTASNNQQTTNSTNLLGTNGNTCIVTGLVIVPGTAIPNNLRLFGNMRTFDEELMLCQRYFTSDFPYGTTPADNVQTQKQGGFAGANNASLITPKSFFPVKMRVTPTMTYYSSNVKASPTAGQWQYFNGTAYVDGSATGSFSTFADGWSVSFTTATITINGAYIVAGSWKADARL